MYIINIVDTKTNETFTLNGDEFVIVTKDSENYEINLDAEIESLSYMTNLIQTEIIKESLKD